MDTASIEAIRVYPPLGIARVGNAPAPNDFVIGPEVIGGNPTLPDGRPAKYVADFRTSEGRIKRQAARFRVYAHLKNGEVQEITADAARIQWRVAVANLKAGWYEFNQAMDLPDGLSQSAQRRNRDIAIPGGRASLDIVPAPQTIEGRDAPAVAFNDGTFWFNPVYLGELRTDAAGRLLFLGGRGTSAPYRPGVKPTTFANNVGWHDDVCDGPVRATVTFADGTSFEAEPGYVVVTPPNFAPGLFGIVTMDDAVRETFRNEGWIAAPTSTSFTQDVWPIFDRLTGLQWVNHGFFIAHGHGSPLDARDTATIDRLRDTGAANEAWRRSVFALFRSPASRDFVEPQIPQIYGDGVDTLFPPPVPVDALALLAVTRTQYEHLERWAAGNFAGDWPGAIPTPPRFDDLDPFGQVGHLERAALHDCLGGPFHPGIEITWIMRLAGLWKHAFRLNVLATDLPAKQDFGDILTPQVCIGPGGPYDGVAAGALTRFMGVPWQTDGVSCNSDADYFPGTFLSMPTFWGARVPDQVLAAANYRRAASLDPRAMPVQVQKHFDYRADWLRDIRGNSYSGRIAHAIDEWWELGMVLPVESLPSYLPPDTRVEQGRNPQAAGSDLKVELVKAIESLGQKLPAAATHALAAAVPRHRVPPKRGFRQGEI